MTVMCTASTGKMRKTVTVNAVEVQCGVRKEKNAYQSGKFAMASRIVRTGRMKW